MFPKQAWTVIAVALFSIVTAMDVRAEKSFKLDPEAEDLLDDMHEQVVSTPDDAEEPQP